MAKIDDLCFRIGATMGHFKICRKHPHFVVVEYLKKDNPTLVDGLLVEDGKIIEAWDYADGKIAAGKTLEGTDPDFNYKGMTVAELVKETFHCSKHPGIVEIKIDFNTHTTMHGRLEPIKDSEKFGS